MPLKISDFTELVKVVNAVPEIWKLGKEFIRTAFPSKNTATRIPSCSGYFRREEDSEIREKLRILGQGRNRSRVKTLLLHGPSGHGKYYSAANLMSTIYTSRITNSILARTDEGKRIFLLERATIRWTLNATNTRTLFESYYSLAKDIGLIEEAKAAYWEFPLHIRTPEGRKFLMYLHDHCEKDAFKEALEQIYETVMKALAQEHSWILLIEGSTENVASLRRFWPQPGDRMFGNGLIIMTTDDDDNSKLLFKDGEDHSTLQKMYIGKMTDHDAIRFLRSKTGMAATGFDTMHAKELAVKLLKCNPQIIAKFGAFVKKYKDETDKNLTYRDLAETETETPHECMLLLEMRRKNQEKLLKFLACCSGGADYLPLQCLENCFEDANETIKHSNFVEVFQRDGVKMVKMHEMDHTTLRTILSGRKSTPYDETLTGVFVKLAKQWSLIEDKTNKIISPMLSALDVLHVIECLSNNCKEALQRSRDEDFMMLPTILPHLKEAVKLSKNLITDLKEKPLVMPNGHACLGEILLLVGESEEARENLEIALHGYKNYNGPENVLLDKANVLHFLGEAYGSRYLGDPSNGERYLKEAFKEKERYYKGKDDPQVAFTLRSLANVLDETGKHSEAIEYAKRAVDIYSKSGHDFRQEYGYSLSTLGSSYRYLGQYRQAEKRLKKALKISRLVDSPSNLRMGVTLSRLASVQRNLGKLDESIESLMEAKEKFGNNDIYSAVILSKLSVSYRHKGDSKNSLIYAEMVAEITDKHLGTKDHPAMATALLNLGHAQTDTGNVEDAEENLKRALKIYKELHGENHRTIVATLNYLGYVYLQMGQMLKAKETLERAVDIVGNYSPSHPAKANSLKRLSKACLICGETARSADLANQALTIYRETYGDMTNREVRKCALRVAYACSKLGLSSKAKEYLGSVELGFPQNIVQPEENIAHPETGKNIVHPEFAVFLRKKNEIALSNLEFSWPTDKEGMRKIIAEVEIDLNRADEIIRQSLGFYHIQHAFLKGEKARLYVLKNHYQEAYREIESAKSIINKNYHRSDVEAGFLLIRADSEGKLEMLDQKEQSLTRAEKLYREALGDSHPMVATTLQKLCQTNIDLKRPKEAQEYFEASEKICEILKRRLRCQLESCRSGFLTNYYLDQHPVLKRQQQLAGRIRSNPAGAWF